MPTTAEKPGIGTYKCTNCGTIVRLDDSDDTLPPCPKCNNTEFDNFSIYGDRMYLVDSQTESCVYEYRIIERN